MLGERIRKLRKQKKMTLEALAGVQLTKGMLSLIENDKAKPSMESLSYIAERLDVNVSELVENVSITELREIVIKAEQIYNQEDVKEPKKYHNLVKVIEPHMDNLTRNYESARLLELYSFAIYAKEKEGWKPFMKRAAEIYNEMNLTSKRVKIAIFRGSVPFVEHQYEEALNVFLTERKSLESQHSFIDPISLLDLDYLEAVLYFAVGKSEIALKVMERAISLSKEKRIFYLIDDLYRLAAVYALDVHDKEKKEYYLMKLKQYGEFADHLPSIQFYQLIKLKTLISEEKHYSKSLELIEEYTSKEPNRYYPWLQAEKGKVLYYLGKYNEAFKVLEKVTIPDNIHHPFDLAMFYVLETYKSLIQLELGNIQRAITYIQKGVELFNPLPESEYKRFCLRTFKKLEKININN